MDFTFLRIPILQKNNCSGIFSLCQTRSVRVTPLTNETGVSCAAPGQCPSPNTRRARHSISMHRPYVVDRRSRTPCCPRMHIYRSRLASRSDSSRQRISSSRTGPFTFRMIDRVWSSMNSTRTWVTPPREPVRPRTRVTLTSLTGCLEASIVATFGSLSGLGGGRERELEEDGTFFRLPNQLIWCVKLQKSPEPHERIKSWADCV